MPIRRGIKVSTRARSGPRLLGRAVTDLLRPTPVRQIMHAHILPVAALVATSRSPPSCWCFASVLAIDLATPAHTYTRPTAFGGHLPVCQFIRDPNEYVYPSGKSALACRNLRFFRIRSRRRRRERILTLARTDLSIQATPEAKRGPASDEGIALPNSRSRAITLEYLRRAASRQFITIAVFLAAMQIHAVKAQGLRYRSRWSAD